MKGCWIIAVWLVLYRAGYFLLCLVVATATPAGEMGAQFHSPDQGPRDEPVATWDRFVAGDGAAYLRIAVSGYQAGDPVCAFYPLWPLTLRAAAFVSGADITLVGLVLANLFSVVGLWVYYRLLQARWGDEVARRGLGLLLALPGALFFAFPYTESLFFMLLMLFWHGLERERIWLAAFAGFLLPTCRAVGVWVLLPLAWHLIEKAWGKSRNARGRLTRSAKTLVHQPLAPVPVAVMGGYALYFGLMKIWTGNAFEGFDAQFHYVNQPSIANIVDVIGFTMAFFDVTASHSPTHSPLDRILFALFLITLPAMWRLDRRFAWWALGAGVIPALSNRFLSYQRFLVMAFPFFVVVALWVDRHIPRFWFGYCLVVAGMMQAWFLIRHLKGLWVA